MRVEEGGSHHLCRGTGNPVRRQAEEAVRGRGRPGRVRAQRRVVRQSCPTSSRSCWASPRKTRRLSTVKWGANLKFFGVKTFFGGSRTFRYDQKSLELVNDDIEPDRHPRCVPVLCDRADGRRGHCRRGQERRRHPGLPGHRHPQRGQGQRHHTQTVDRAGLFEAQTPQVFETALLKKAYENLDNLDKSPGHRRRLSGRSARPRGHLVETDSSNIKITRPSDVAIAEAIIKSRPKAKPDGPIGPYIEAQW